MIQVIVMSSDKYYHCLPGYCWQFDKYWGMSQVSTVICGFSPIESLMYPEYSFHSVGKHEDYPPGKWSDALIKVLDDVASEVFILLLEDYWLTRQVDARAIEMMYDYMHQFKNVIKFDLGTDRLYAEGGSKYVYNYNGYDTLGYLDLIKSSPTSPYHLSLWGGMWRRDLLRKVLAPGETAQQIELNGTNRLAQYGDELLVLGTRQAPLKHANVIQRGEWNPDPMTGVFALTQSDREELKRLGYL